MAWVPFDQFLLKQWNGNAIDLDAASGLKVGLLTDSYTPTVATDALWSGISSNEVATGSSYSAGGPTLGSNTVTLDSGTVTFDGADVTISQDGSGFTDARYAVIYQASDGKLICYADLGSDRSIVGGDLTLQIDAAGILTKS